MEFRVTLMLGEVLLGSGPRARAWDRRSFGTYAVHDWEDFERCLVRAVHAANAELPYGKNCAEEVVFEDTFNVLAYWDGRAGKYRVINRFLWESHLKSTASVDIRLHSCVFSVFSGGDSA